LKSFAAACVKGCFQLGRIGSDYRTNCSIHSSPPASRALSKSPGFALAGILTLALGIGVTSAIFSVVYGVLLKPSPYVVPDHLCLLWKSVPKKNLDRDWTSYPTYQDWKRNAGSFVDLAAYLRPDGSIVNLTGTDNVEQVQSAKYSSNFFSVLGTSAALGRTFTADDVGSNPNLAVVSFLFGNSISRLKKTWLEETLRLTAFHFE
jgi:putative ABC transport system permease protein